MIDTKTCCNCFKIKIVSDDPKVSEFHPNKTAKHESNKFQSYCKTCKAETLKGWRDRQKEIMKTILTIQQAAAIIMVRNGADIWERFEAGVFRKLQETTGDDLIKITKAMNAPENGAERQPYFGVIATKAGITLAEAMLQKHYAFKAGTRFTPKRGERIFMQVSK